MSDDIAMTLASNGAIRVEAPIPGKNAVGIEVPNAQVSPVSLRELIDSEEFRVRYGMFLAKHSITTTTTQTAVTEHVGDEAGEAGI